jgi:3-oxoacyl-[acyl-carrier protein] reductase
MTAGRPVAVVTGAGRGIGRTLAVRLARTHRVVGLGRSEEALAEVAAECAVVPVPVDVADPASVAQAWARVRVEVGDPDLVVNNAGVSGRDAPVWEQPVDAWWRVFEVNVRGTFLICRAALPAMVSRGSGRIVNVASNAAFHRTWDDLGGFDRSAYMASKAAVIRLSEVLAGETVGRGVTVFAISPGRVKTDMTASFEAFRGDWDDPSLWSPPELAADLVEFIATGALDALSGRFINAAQDDWRTMPGRASQIAAADAHTLRIRPE